MRLIEGGAITSELTTIAAYGVLILSAALGLWTLSSALAIGGVLGSLFFAAAFLGLAFDVLDLFRLTSGELSPEDYLVEMAVGLLLEAGLGGLGDIVRRIGAANLASEIVQRVVRQLDEWTGGATLRLRQVCVTASGALVVPAQQCAGLTDQEIVEYSQFVTTRSAWEQLDAFSQLMTSRGGDGGEAVRRLLNNNAITRGGSGRIEAIARTIVDAPKVDGFDAVVEKVLNQTRNVGFPYELRRAIALHNPSNGVRVVEYGRTKPIQFKRVVDVDRTTRRPILGDTDTQLLEGDVVLEVVEGNETKIVFIDTKHGKQSDITELRIWNQIRKAAEALQTGKIDEYRFESSRSMLRSWQEYVEELSDAPKYRDMNPPLNERLQFVTNLKDDF